MIGIPSFPSQASWILTILLQRESRNNREKGLAQQSWACFQSSTTSQDMELMESEKAQVEMCQNASSGYLWLVRTWKIVTVFLLLVHFPNFLEWWYRFFYSFHIFENLLFCGLIKNSSIFTLAFPFSLLHDIVFTELYI